MSVENRGKFISFEGGERVGKSTYLNMLEEYLARIGRRPEFVFSREPGGSPIAERIRELLLDKRYFGEMSAHAEAALYAAARCQHIDDVILPTLNSGKSVVCDRYIHSSYAYQAYARGLGFEYVRAVNGYAVKRCMPDAVVFIDLSPDRAYFRKGSDRLESESGAFHRSVYEGFKSLEKTEKNFFPVVPSGSKEETFEKIIEILKNAGVL